MSTESDRNWSAGVRSSAEYLRLHHDEPNEYIPRHFTCAECEADCFEEGLDEEIATRCVGGCGNWLCAEHKTEPCPSCRAESDDATGVA